MNVRVIWKCKRETKKVIDGIEISVESETSWSLPVTVCVERARTVRVECGDCH